MGRRARRDAHGGIQHVMNRGVDRQRVFFADRDRVEFGRRLAHMHEHFGVETLAYCLMDNHYHLLLRTPKGGLSQAMQHLGLVYTRHTNDRVGRDGPLFRGRFHSVEVTTDGYLSQAARYIHRNPLDLPGVATPSAYRWSSYRTYLGHRRAPSFLATDVVLALNGDDRSRLARFTDDASAVEWITDVADLRQQLLLSVAVHDLATDHDQVAHKVERTAMILLMDRLGRHRLARAIADHLSFPTAEAHRMAVRRARRRADDPVVAHAVAACLALIARARVA